jgi:hypothetical protein
MDGPGFNQRPRLVWLVSVDPYGGAFVEDLPACGSYDYIIDFIDPVSARVLVGTADSHARGLRPLPVIGPAPHVTPGTGCHPGPPLETRSWPVIAPAGPLSTGTMEHRSGYNRLNAAS